MSNMTSNMTSDTQSNTQQAGYRLQTLEVFNWGTFDGLYRLNTNTHTALLTGKNGSGKSTLVDALITLLVPYYGAGGRNYNQAAGTSGRERSETTYVLGAYGQRTHEATGKTETQYLRNDAKKKTYSVLLAVFYNPALDKTITLAIVFWMSSGSLKKFHVVAECPLNFLEHFRAESDIGRTLKRELRNLDDVEVHDTFTRYSTSLTRKLYLGEKAVTLFNQIVSIKDIPDLPEFIRRHMLEEYDSQAAIDDLRSYYDNLTTAYEAIEKAEDQLNYLEPILNVAGRHRDQQERIAYTRQKIEAVEIYISAIQKDALNKEITALTTQVSDAEAAFQQVNQTLADLQQERRELQRAIDNDDMGQRLQQLKTGLNQLQDDFQKRTRQQERYQKAAEAVGLMTPHSAEDFQANQVQAHTELDKIKDELDDIDTRRISLGVKRKQLQQEGREIEDEIKSLQQRKSQIPGHDIKIRNRLLASLRDSGLDVSEETFPFVGELLKVREDYEEWEPAIQRLLGGFGRQLLVPADYYFSVSDFVEQTNLKGRLVYHHVKETRPVSEDHLPSNSLFHRLQFKTGTGFRDWLREKIIKSYSYVCAENLSEFRRATRAMTINGQVKHGSERHEKDDRYRLGDRSRYVLGWENEAKIRLLQSQLNELGNQFDNLAAHDNNLTDKKNTLTTRQNNLNALLFFDAFDTIDAGRISQQLDAKKAEYNRLQKQVEHSQLALLREQLADTDRKIHETDDEKGQLNRKIGGLTSDLNNQTTRLKQVEAILHDVDMDTMSELLNEIHEDMLDNHGREPTLADSEAAERQLRTRYNELRDGQNTRLRAMEREATGLMKDFKAVYGVETQDVDASLEPSAVTWYEEKYEQIQHHDLPRYKTEFEELVRKKITESITSFRSGMLNQVNDYRKRIDQLNESLKQISYTSETYIQLTYDNTTDQQIRAFQTDLSNCFPDTNLYGDEANKRAYLNVRELIHRLDNETTWAKKVTDVRNWLDFGADERRKSDDSQQERYEGASGKSGGQKAKLAYTIMASAIAYQYGIFRPRRDAGKTFRFVVVDEVFSKSDESNSRFAMDLFRQLGLQVLVVTPSDKIHIVEPYIGICHWVKNNEEGNDSRVADISVEQLQQTRMQTGAAD